MKYKIILHYPNGEDEEQEEMFITEIEATNYANYLVGCSRIGAETLHLSNPGDYPFDENDFDQPEFSIVEIYEQ